MPKPLNEAEKEIARRRDEVIRQMAKTPPKPHKFGKPAPPPKKETQK